MSVFYFFLFFFSCIIYVFVYSWWNLLFVHVEVYTFKVIEFEVKSNLCWVRTSLMYVQRIQYSYKHLLKNVRKSWQFYWDVIIIILCGKQWNLPKHLFRTFFLFYSMFYEHVFWKWHNFAIKFSVTQIHYIKITFTNTIKWIWMYEFMTI